MSPIEEFPTDWSRALVLVAHPDDPEYGMAAAVAKWTGEGKTVSYALASTGEAGIEGMTPAQAGPLRKILNSASAAVVGVDDVEFWGFPDSQIMNTPELRAAVLDAIDRHRPDVVLSLYGGPEWAPGMPNQRDHMEFAAAVEEAWIPLPEGGPRWLFCNGPGSTYVVDVDGFVAQATDSLAEHKVYLEFSIPRPR